MTVGPLLQKLLLAIAQGGRVGLAHPDHPTVLMLHTAGRVPIVLSPEHTVVVAEVGPNHVTLRCGSTNPQPYVLVLVEQRMVQSFIDPQAADIPGVVRTLYRLFAGRT